MRRRISLYMLVATVVLIGILFYRVIEPFIFSLLFASVLSVLFRPVFGWATKKLKGRERTAATLTTLAIMLLFLLPLGAALVIAAQQMVEVTNDVLVLAHFGREGQVSGLADEWEQVKDSLLVERLVEWYADLEDEWKMRLQTIGTQAADGVVKKASQTTVGLVGDVVGFLVGMVVTALTLYYLFIDGDMILKEVKELSPLGDDEEDALVEQFGKVCRGVVVGTVVAALVQAVLAGIGFFFAGVPNIPLLMTVTMIFAFIPFFGAGSVVMAVAAWLALSGHYTAAVILFLYSAAVVSTSDNFIRAYI
ncbi:MAG: AI-2E family transporter, partial [Aeoliella sp.]